MAKERRTRRLYKGGSKIGQGKFGTVFSPPLKCGDGANVKWASTKYVSKTTTEDSLEREFVNSLLIKKLDPNGDWSVTAEHACKIAPGQNSKNYDPGESNTHQIIFKNSGVNLYDLLLKPGVKGDVLYYKDGLLENGAENLSAFSNLDPNGLSLLIKQLRLLLPKLAILNQTYVHGDLHLGNIISDGTTPKIIDFDTLISVETRVLEQTKLYYRCLTVKKGCEWVKEQIDKCILDEVRSLDVMAIWTELKILLNSKWVQTVFPGKYDVWLSKNEGRSRGRMFRADYEMAILNCPE
jgi:hypothetical protein